MKRKKERKKLEEKEEIRGERKKKLEEKERKII